MGVVQGQPPIRRRVGGLQHSLTAEQVYADAELRLGRPLTLAERNIDIVGLDRDLAYAKKRLHEAIEKEKRRALNAYFRYKRPIKIRVTPEMLYVLNSIYTVGVKHGIREVETLAGVNLPRSYSQKNDVDRMAKRLQAKLRPLEKKAVHKAVALDIGHTAQIAATRTVLQMPGALNVASQLVSSTLFAGIGSVYAENAGLFGSWTYSAVMDSATCDICEGHDGEEYASWDEIENVLPDGGPNPDCDGEGRCRCRAVPSSTSDEAAAAGGGGILPAADSSAEEAAIEGDLTPTEDFALLPKHARQPVETLGRDEAAAQLKKIEGNIRGLHWHAKNGRPINPAKLAAYERRKEALQAHIRGGTVPRPVTPPVAPPVAPRPVEPLPRVTPAPTPFVSPANPFVGQTRDELKAALTKRNNQIAGVKKQIKTIEQTNYDPFQHARYQELRIRLTQLEAERARIKEAQKVAPTTPRAAPATTTTGEVPVADYFTSIVKPTRSSRAYETRQYADAGMSIMDRVFLKYHDEGEVAKIEMNFRPSRNAYGTYWPGRRIGLSPGDSYADTFWHEFGHFIDYQGFGTREFRRVYYNAMSESGAGGLELDPLLKVIKSTGAVAKIESAARGRSSSFVSAKHARYLLTNRELFARAFSQYVHRKAEELYERGLLTEAEGDALAMSRHKMYRRSQDEYGTQWEDEDFEPIYEAMDEFFRARGWLR